MEFNQGLKNMAQKSIYPGLSQLRKAGSRRRIADPEVVEQEEYEPDFTNVSNTETNMPTPTMEGGIAPESYDVRANEVINPEEEQSNTYENLGRQLGTMAQKQEAEGIAASENIQAPEEEAIQETAEKPSVWNRLANIAQKKNAAERARVFNPQSVPEAFGPILKPVGEFLSQVPEAVVAAKPINRNPYKMEQNVPMAPAEQQPLQQEAALEQEQVDLANDNSMQEKIDIAMQNPYEISVYGSTDEIARSPELQKKFSTITGQNWDEEVARQLKTYEEALAPYHEEINGVVSGLTADAQRIRDRIDANQSTDMDKYYIGLSLALPLIIGGFFGGEAGLAALGGAAQGYGEALTNRQKAITNDEELLADINRKRAEAVQHGATLKLKEAGLPQEIRKNLPQNPMAHLEEARAIDYTDPDTGVTSKAPEIAHNLFVKPNLVKTQKEKEAKEKQSEKLIETKNYVDDLNKLTSEAIEIVSQLKDKNIFKKAFINSIKGKDSSGILSKLSQDVIVDGRKVNAGIELSTIIGLITTKYSDAYKLRQLTGKTQEHVHKILNNPESSFASPEDVINQLLLINRESQNGLLSSAKNGGFIPVIWEDEIREQRNKIYSHLNKKEAHKESERRKLQAVRNQ